MKKIVFLLFCLSTVYSTAFSQVSGLGFGRNRNQATSSQDLVDYTNPKEYTIGGVSVVGAEFLNQDAIVSMTGLKMGDKIKIPSETITNAIKKLWKQGLVGDVNISVAKFEGDKVYLQVTLKERARMSRYVFKGIRKGQATSISEKIKLIKGKILNDAVLKNTENKVKEYFMEKGYLNCKVKIVPRKEDTIYAKKMNYVYLDIVVDKGNKTKISKIDFVGASEITEKKLKKKMKKTKEKFVFRIFTPSKFVKKEYEADKEKVIAYYHKLGYRNVAIESDTIIPNPDGTVSLKMNIFEGKKFYYRNIKWTGNYVYSDTVLSRVLNINKGDVYNREELDKRLSFSPNSTDVTSLYMDDGYLFFRIEPVETQVKDDSVDIEMRMFEGEQATINKIILKGNTRTSDHVVMREIRTQPGQKFSRADLIRTQRELSTIGYFNPEKIGINPIPNMADQTVDIVYDLEEKPSDQIELSGGWGGFQGFIGTVGLVFNNFSLRKVPKFREWRPLPQGDGQRLSLRVQANGFNYQNYSLSFTEPWLGGKKPQSLSVSLSHAILRSRRQTVTGDIINSSLQISTATLSLGRRLQFPDDFFTMSNSLSFNIYQLDRYTGVFGTYTDGTSYNFNFNTTISRNSIDNPTYPRQGSSMTLSMSFTPPWSLFSGKNYAKEGITDQDRYRLVEYHKWMFDNSWFLKLAGNLVLHTRAHLGFLGTYNSVLGYTPFERFSVGGSGLMVNNFLIGQDLIGLRGYTDNSIKPQQPDGNGGFTYSTGGLGGVVYNKYVLELRYPISLNPSATIFLLGFAEGGNNWGSFSDFNPFNMKRTVGFGARIFMPAFGMLGLDYGVPLDNVEGNPNARQPFTFTIGQQIR
jgi:outer membrane protein insertion porin family